jgi:hypothetical protein
VQNCTQLERKALVFVISGGREPGVFSLVEKLIARASSRSIVRAFAGMAGRDELVEEGSLKETGR